MKFSLIVCSPEVRRGLAAAAVLLLAWTAGCASPGQPRPPSLNLPEVVKDLTAQRVGDVVELRWTTPDKTTDRLEVKGAMTAEVCRIAVASAATSGCISVARLPVQPGATHRADALPPALTVDPPALLAYRVQVLNAHGRSAGPSTEVFAASGVAPAAVEQLRAVATADGAMVEWQKKDTTAQVELDRVPVGADGVAVEPAAPKTVPKASSKTLLKKQMIGQPTGSGKAGSGKAGAMGAPPKLLQGAPAALEEKLRTPAELADAGGTIDRTAKMGESYRYTAQRVRTIMLDGHRLEVRSFVSAPVTVVMRNMFPPRAPEGLEAAPGGTAGGRSIDLSWTPNTERDLAGYIVYRQEIDAKGVAAGTATRLNPTPVAGPAYRDETAEAGRHYAYFITAINTAGNESAPGEAVQETVREQ